MSNNKCSNHSKLLILALVCFAATACKTDLYTNLPQKEANEMMAILLNNRIGCSKEEGKEQTWIVRVDSGKMAQAVELLKDAGYPKDHFDSMGSVFQKKGLISSPLEERVRFIYALSEEIAETISLIDGVLSSRVLVVIPENDPLNDVIMPSSASVFIRYSPESDITNNIQKIKKHVVNSIEGLTYDKVTVSAFPAIGVAGAEETPLRETLGVYVHPSSIGRFWIMVVLVGLLLSFAILGGIYGWMWLQKSRRSAEEPTPFVEEAHA